MNIITEDPENSPPHTSVHTPTSSITMTSPMTSVFSPGHNPKSSSSSLSLTSSPIPRDSFDLYASRLGMLAEEPQEKEDVLSYSTADHMSEDNSYDQYFASDLNHVSPTSPTSNPSYSFGDQPDWDDLRYFKRQRSSHESSLSVGNRLSSRFNSISRRWRDRSGPGPQLSIITHISAPASRTGSAASSQLMSPAMSAISRHESFLPPSPTRTALEGSLHGSDAFSIPELPQYDEEFVQATTPLLPPVLAELAESESPVQSPLQSPAIAPTQTGLIGRISIEAAAGTTLPSPPLSTKPSLVSIRQRSRANTGTSPQLGEVPALSMLDEHKDPWASKLGHADFSIHPEPYLPGLVNLGSYTEFRTNWDQARTNYAKHLARIIEHYGSTSKVFKLTEEKWSSIDESWKSHNAALSRMLVPLLPNASDADIGMTDQSSSDLVLEKPVTRIIVPPLNDTAGKFPEIGDGEIVGPMQVVAPRAASMRRSLPLTPISPRKRNVLKFLQDMFARA